MTTEDGAHREETTTCVAASPAKMRSFDSPARSPKNAGGTGIERPAYCVVYVPKTGPAIEQPALARAVSATPASSVPATQTAPHDSSSERLSPSASVITTVWFNGEGGT